ncbi:MAG: hypothetical protein U9R74_00115 [Pseudomonadota bacterium]|nr:hypothetical protein [Pseudomonadota bacterium]
MVNRLYQPLQRVPVPPMLERALGYDGYADLVAFWWSLLDDELCYADGVTEIRGANRDAWLDYVNHPAVAPQLHPYDFGSRDVDAAHRLLLDRRDRRIAITDPITAVIVLAESAPAVTTEPNEPNLIGFRQLIEDIKELAWNDDNAHSRHERHVRYDEAHRAMTEWLDALEIPHL